MLSPLVKKALRGLAAPRGADHDELAVPPSPVGKAPGSPVLRPLTEPDARAASPVLRPLPADHTPPSAVLRPLSDAPASRPASGVLRPLTDEPPSDERPRSRFTTGDDDAPTLRPLRDESDVPDAPAGSRVLRPLAAPAPSPRSGTPAVARLLAREPDPEEEEPRETMARSSLSALPRDEAPSRADEDEPPPFAPARPARAPQVALNVGRTFVATLILSLCSQVASALLAAAAGAGAVYVVATALSSGVAEVMAILVFTMVIVVWAPATVQLASRSAWRTALKEHGIARGVAEGIASSLVPRRWSDGSVAGDPAGLGLYGLRDRVRLALDQALSDSLRMRWARRCVSVAAATKTDEAMKTFLGPVEGFGNLNRDGVRTALADAIEAALIGKGVRGKKAEEAV